MTHLHLVPEVPATDSRPWCEDIPEKLTAPIDGLEVVAAELYWRGIITMPDFVTACAGSQVRAGLALDAWHKSKGWRET